MGAEPSGATAPSYQAMLLTHAKTASGPAHGGGGGGFNGVSRPGPGDSAGAERGVTGGSGMGVASEEDEEAESKEIYSIALDLNYEVSQNSC